MKACPFCAEEIQDAAVVCRWCGRDLATAHTTPPVPSAALQSAVEDHAARGWLLQSRTDRSATLVATGKPVNHILHVILSLLTLGLWLFVWLLLVLGHQKDVRRVIYVRADESLAYRDNDGPELVYAIALADATTKTPTTTNTTSKKALPGWVIALGFVAVLMVFALAASQSRRERGFYDRFPNADRGGASRVDQGDDLTLGAFLRIQDGMSYAEVTQIVGRAGTLSVSSDSGGRIYTWKRARCCANMSVHLRDDRVISKSQAGLE